MCYPLSLHVLMTCFHPSSWKTAFTFPCCCFSWRLPCLLFISAGLSADASQPHFLSYCLIMLSIMRCLGRVMDFPIILSLGGGVKMTYAITYLSLQYYNRINENQEFQNILISLCHTVAPHHLCSLWCHNLVAFEQHFLWKHAEVAVLQLLPCQQIEEQIVLLGF